MTSVHTLYLFVCLCVCGHASRQKLILFIHWYLKLKNLLENVSVCPNGTVDIVSTCTSQVFVSFLTFFRIMIQFTFTAERFQGAFLQICKFVL